MALTTALGSGLVNTLYVLDEPSVGLHPSDVGRLIAIVGDLRDAGNTVVVVEHDRRSCGRPICWSTSARGRARGEGSLLYAGPPEGVGQVAGSATGEFLSGRKRSRVPQPGAGRRPGRELRLTGARGQQPQEHRRRRSRSASSAS